MVNRVYIVTDDVRALEKGVRDIVGAMLPERMMSGRRFFMEAPGSSVDVTAKVDDWLKMNVDLFRNAFPDGGRFEMKDVVPVSHTDNDDFNSEDYNVTQVTGFTLTKDGEFLFDLESYNHYYDADLDDEYGVGLDEVMSMVKNSDSLSHNLYSVFKKILEGTDKDFKTQGTFDSLVRGSLLTHDRFVVKQLKPLIESGTFFPSLDHNRLMTPGNKIGFDVLTPSGRMLGDNHVFGMRFDVDSVFRSNVVELDGLGPGFDNVPSPFDFLGISDKNRAYHYADYWDGYYHPGYPQGVKYEVKELPFVSAEEILDGLRRKLLCKENLENLSPCYKAWKYDTPSPVNVLDGKQYPLDLDDAKSLDKRITHTDPEIVSFAESLTAKILLDHPSFHNGLSVKVLNSDVFGLDPVTGKFRVCPANGKEMNFVDYCSFRKGNVLSYQSTEHCIMRDVKDAVRRQENVKRLQDFENAENGPKKNQGPKPKK